MTDEHVHPDAAEIAPIYGRLVELADDHLPDPTTAEITTYDDGTFKIRVFHRRALDEREVLQYHSKYGDVRRAVVSDETVVKAREVTDSVDRLGG